MERLEQNFFDLINLHTPPPFTVPGSLGCHTALQRGKISRRVPRQYFGADVPKF